MLCPVSGLNRTGTRRTSPGESVNRKSLGFSLICLVLAASVASQLTAAPQQTTAPPAPSPTAQRPLLDKYCVTCHSDKLKTGGLSLQSADISLVTRNLNARQPWWPGLCRSWNWGIG